jgi:hypothetical protein
MESVAIEVLTLIEGLAREELLRSRFTRREVRLRLLALAEAAQAVSGALRQRLPEIDWDAWARSAARMERGGAPEEEALWFAACMLTSSTLGWLRLYRQQQPELFDLAL